MLKENKTTQMAAYFLKRANGRMPYIKLLKLLYYADRQMLISYGTPMTNDQWFAMKNGPVLSATYDLIKSNRGSIWSQYIATENYDVTLVDDPGNDELSNAENEILSETYRKHGKKDKWDLVAETHGLPEWEDPGEGANPITYRCVLESEGVPLHEIQQTLENIKAETEIDEILARVR